MADPVVDGSMLRSVPRSEVVDSGEIQDRFVEDPEVLFPWVCHSVLHACLGNPNLLRVALTQSTSPSPTTTMHTMNEKEKARRPQRWSPKQILENDDASGKLLILQVWLASQSSSSTSRKSCLLAI